MLDAYGESPHQRFFAQTNEGDPRQVYALDMHGDAPAIFFLARGGATQAVRRSARSGAYRCPVPRCPCPTFKMVRAGSKRDHFVHEFDPGRDHLDVPPAFYVTRLLAARMLQEGYNVKIGATLASDVTADVLVQGANGDLAVIFVASERLSESVIKSQAHAARRFDASARWVFSVPGPLSQVHDVERREFSWLVTRQKYGMWVNPIEHMVLTEPTDPVRRSVAPVVIPFDQWNMTELDLVHLEPIGDPALLPEPCSVWSDDGVHDGEDREPAEDECAWAVHVLTEDGFTGVLLVTDQESLEARLADALAPTLTVERVAVEGILRGTLGDRLVLIFGSADFVEEMLVRLPDYAEDQSIAYMPFRPASVFRAVWAIGQRAWA